MIVNFANLINSCLFMFKGLMLKSIRIIRKNFVLSKISNIETPAIQEKPKKVKKYRKIKKVEIFNLDLNAITENIAPNKKAKEQEITSGKAQNTEKKDKNAYTEM